MDIRIYFIGLPGPNFYILQTFTNLVTSLTTIMIDNIAKSSISTDRASQQANKHIENSSAESSKTSPARVYDRHLVVPNAPKVERRRHVPASQFTGARRNIFLFLINEE